MIKQMKQIVRIKAKHFQRVIEKQTNIMTMVMMQISPSNKFRKSHLMRMKKEMKLMIRNLYLHLIKR